MPVNNPEDDEYNYKDGYWRCGRNGGCGQTAGWGTDHPGVGACKLHGGAGGRPVEHGIFSDVVREEDQAVLDALEELSTAKKLEETLNLQVMKLRRAVSLMDDPDREADFWDTFTQLVENAGDGGELQATHIRELANMLNTPHQAQRDLMDLIRKTAKDLHKVTEGETVRHEHDVDEETLSELKNRLESL